MCNPEVARHCRLCVRVPTFQTQTLGWSCLAHHRESVRYWNIMSDLIQPWRSREMLSSLTKRRFFSDIASLSLYRFLA